MKLTAGDLLAHGIIDEILPEPLGGAHNEPKAAADAVAAALKKTLFRMRNVDPDA